MNNYDNHLSARKEEKNKVGNFSVYVSHKVKQWIYSTESDRCDNENQILRWHELLVIEFNPNFRHLVLTDGGKVHPDYDFNYPYAQNAQQTDLMRKFLRPDLVLQDSGSKIEIIDYKDVAFEFYINPSNLSPKKHNKYRHDVIKQLTYELAIQQTHTVSRNKFFIPYYYNLPPTDDPLGEIEASLDIKGIRIFKANFLLIKHEYLQENV